MPFNDRARSTATKADFPPSEIKCIQVIESTPIHLVSLTERSTCQSESIKCNSIDYLTQSIVRYLHMFSKHNLFVLLLLGYNHLRYRSTSLMSSLEFPQVLQRAFIETYISYLKYILTDNSKFDLLTRIHTFRPKLIAVCLSYDITFANVVQ